MSRILTYKRARAYAAVLVALYLVAWVYELAYGSPPLNAAGVPIGGDYIAFHTAGRLLLAGQGAQLYDRAAVMAIQSSLVGGQIPGFYDAFRNPPFFALPFVPLALLDLLPGFAVWALISLGCLGLALYLLQDGVSAPWRARWRGVLLLVLAFAPVYFGVIDGENATVSLLVFVLIYRALVRGQDGAAGAWAALGLFKPQLFFVFPLVFLVTRRWRALAVYVSSAVALGVVSLALVGYEGMQAWLRIILEAERGNAAANAWRMMSLKSFFDSLLVGQTQIALGLYVISAAFLLLLLLRVWSRSQSPTPSLWAFMSLVAVLIDPHLVDYDLTVLVAAGLLVAPVSVQLRWSIVVLYLVAASRATLPLGAASLQLAAPVLALCAYLTWNRKMAGSESAPISLLANGRNLSTSSAIPLDESRIRRSSLN